MDGWAPKNLSLESRPSQVGLEAIATISRVEAITTRVEAALTLIYLPSYFTYIAAGRTSILM